jgi:hypothetical protein
MELLPTHPEDDELPIWNQRELWEKAAAAGKLFRPVEDQALELDTCDPRPKVNEFVLEMGPQKCLHSRGKYVVDTIRAICGFDAASDWRAQKQWICNVFRDFYEPDDECLGWYSVLTARRPAQFRKEQDRTIRIRQLPARLEYLHPESDPANLLGIPSDGLYFARPVDTVRSKCRVAMIEVPRYITCDRFGIDDEGYRQFWFCLGRPGEDDDALKAGRLPAVPASDYHRSVVRVRQTVLLNLVKVTRTLGFKDRTIEFDPESGAVLSIRRVGMPLTQAILSGAPIEHRGVKRILGR